MITYPIHEMFYTFQGEGSWMGRPAFFVRTFGCPVKCDFCDAAGTWHPDWIPKDIVRYTAARLVETARAAGATTMVVTGGEPAIFDWNELTQIESGVEFHLETSGAFEIKGDFNWIVLSPKTAKPPIAQAVKKANEFKLIIGKPSDVDLGIDMLLAAGFSRRDEKDIWLHPEWSQRDNRVVQQYIIETVKRGEYHFRAGWQLHKLYLVDSYDKRSRPLVPLGGDLAKGY